MRLLSKKSLRRIFYAVVIVLLFFTGEYHALSKGASVAMIVLALASLLLCSEQPVLPCFLLLLFPSLSIVLYLLALPSLPEEIDLFFFSVSAHFFVSGLSLLAFVSVVAIEDRVDFPKPSRFDRAIVGLLTGAYLLCSICLWLFGEQVAGLILVFALLLFIIYALKRTILRCIHTKGSKNPL